MTERKLLPPPIVPDPVTMHVRGESERTRALRIALARAERTLLPEDYAALTGALRAQRQSAQRWRMMTALYALALGLLMGALAYLWPVRYVATVLLIPALGALAYSVALAAYTAIKWES